MNHLRPNKTGIALAKVFGAIKLIWVILVAGGWAQGVINFGLWANMIKMPLIVAPFDTSAAVALIVVAAAVGYVIGYLFARLWNWLHR